MLCVLFDSTPKSKHWHVQQRQTRLKTSVTKKFNKALKNNKKTLNWTVFAASNNCQTQLFCFNSSNCDYQCARVKFFLVLQINVVESSGTQSNDFDSKFFQFANNSRATIIIDENSNTIKFFFFTKTN